MEFRQCNIADRDGNFTYHTMDILDDGSYKFDDKLLPSSVWPALDDTLFDDPAETARKRIAIILQRCNLIPVGSVFPQSTTIAMQEYLQEHFKAI
jgi:hypothetical protein